VVNQDLVSVIALAGELEYGRRTEIRDSLQLKGVEKSILLDFSDVTYADSTALAELMRFHIESDACAVPVAVLIGHSQFSRLLTYAGLSDRFAVYEDRGAALAFLAKKP
jgi:anti-anti-sigma factor